MPTLCIYLSPIETGATTLTIFRLKVDHRYLTSTSWVRGLAQGKNS